MNALAYTALMFKIIILGTGASGSCLEDLGCWKDRYYKRAISGDNRFPQHGNDYLNNIRDLVEDCRNYAESRGWAVFAAQYQRECFTSADAGSTLGGGGQLKKSQKKSKSISGILGWALTFFDPEF